jgi:TatD DNase family protein
LSAQERRAELTVIDTHCHLDLPAFDPDRAATLDRARAAGVEGVLVPGIRPATWNALADLPARHPGVAIALGVHPQILPDLDSDERARCRDLVATLATAVDAAGPAVVAIGECGLDGTIGERDEQERVMRAHVRAARALGLPLILHVYRAHDLAPRLLREERAGDVGGVLHSYSGSAELVPVYRDLGFAFSFAGPVTYPGARRPRAAVGAVPAELLLAETDAPDQAPEPHRGGRSEPAFVAEIVRGLAAARGAAPAEIASLTAANAQRLFPRARSIWSIGLGDGKQIVSDR